MREVNVCKKFDLVALANSGQEHNVVVCTLCSCYPWALLGLPPSWYKDFAYRSRVVIEPRAVLEEFGLELEGPRSFNNTLDAIS